ncbi:hypothetical protein ACFO8N_05160 [Sneathiella chungangensis]|uniref:hypothetical protein n=1 Tax=Sneathiella chungangensis TaxID=1418234 RepID=UPI0018841A49|nr:hypothetical protein [Sneathiella chungangensis]
MASLRRRKVGKKTLALRSKLWPDLPENEFWDRNLYDGFTSIPRTLPIVMNIIDGLTKNKPASRTYFVLWCTAFDEMYVSLSKQEDLAFQSGFTGQRAIRTWRERMLSLEEFGFIKTAAGSRGDLSHAVIINPHFVIRRLYKNNTPGLTAAAYNTLLERANEIGAKDMEFSLPEEEDGSDAIRSK